MIQIHNFRGMMSDMFYHNDHTIVTVFHLEEMLGGGGGGAWVCDD